MNGYKGDEKDRKLMIPVAAIFMSVVALVGIGYAAMSSSVTSDDNLVTTDVFAVDVLDVKPNTWTGVDTTTSSNGAFTGTLTKTTNKSGATNDVTVTETTYYDGTAYLKVFADTAGTDTTQEFDLSVVATGLASASFVITTEGGTPVATASVSNGTFVLEENQKLNSGTVYIVNITDLAVEEPSTTFKLIFTAIPSA